MDVAVDEEPTPVGVFENLEITVSAIVPLEVLSCRYAVAVVLHERGNKAKAARVLGVDRRTLYRLLDRARKLGIGARP